MSKKADVIPAIKKIVAMIFKFIKENKKLTIATLVFIFLYWLIFIPHGSSTVTPNKEPKYIYDKVDVNGLTIEKACEILREKGWKISSVNGVNNYETVEKSDCSDKTHSATTVDYYASDLNSNIYDTANLNFNSDKKPETKTDSNSNSETNSSKTETPAKSDGGGDETVAKIEQSVLSGGICSFKQSPEQVISVSQVGTSATTEFINLGIKLFNRDTCKEFGYQLDLLTKDERGNESRNIVLQFNVTKSIFKSYNWKNLEGRIVGAQLKNDGVITMINTNIGLDPSKFELYSLE